MKKNVIKDQFADSIIDAKKRDRFEKKGKIWVPKNDNIVQVGLIKLQENKINTHLILSENDSNFPSIICL